MFALSFSQFDPTETLPVHCGNDFDDGFQPYLERRDFITELLRVVADPNDKRVPEVVRACLSTTMKAGLGANAARLRA